MPPAGEQVGPSQNICTDSGMTSQSLQEKRVLIRRSLYPMSRAGTPDGMLTACEDVATQNPSPDGWVHSAAVLDYFAPALNMKKPSGENTWAIELNPGRKHIAELAQYVQGKRRIGFKLETGVTSSELRDRAEQQLQKYGVDATIANILEQINEPDTPRAYMVTNEGMRPLETLNEVCDAILEVLTN